MHRGVAAIVCLVGMLAAAPSAWADAEEVESKTAEAMESYDLMEFEAARRMLEEVVASAERQGVDDSAVAKAYLSLGIVYFSGLDKPGEARKAIEKAVSLDPSIEISVAYRTDELSEMVEAARAAAGAGGDCNVDGLEHELIDTAEPGEPRQVSARLGSGTKAAAVKLYYRPVGATDFVEVEMEQDGACEYTATIPGDVMDGEFVHYYVAAVNRRGREVANKGSSGSPNIIEVTSLDFGDDENPLGSDADIEDEAEEGAGGPSSLFLSLAVGSGGGYVTGQTELAGNDVACCFAPALLHLMPEVGYYLSPQTSLSVAFRMGFPIGANIEGHATFAPAGLLLLRHAVTSDGEGLMVSGILGGGILRNTVKLDNPENPSMDTDTTAAGPVLVGAGVGWAKALSDSMKLVAEVNAIAGLTAGITEIGSGPGSTRPHFGLQFDANLGVLFGF